MTTVATNTPYRVFVPAPAPRTTKSAGTRRRLLGLAAELFIERGYQGVSMRDIAAAAHLTKGALYGHFRSKGQLLVEVIRWLLAERDHAPDFGEVIGDPERAIGLMHDQLGRDIRLLEVDAAAAARHDPDVAAGLADLYVDRHARIREAIADLADPETAAWVVSAVTAGIGMREAAGLPAPARDRLNAALLSAMRGLIAPYEPGTTDSKP